MQSVQYLIGRFEEAVLNGTWISNTNFQEVIHDLDWKEAVLNVEKLNTIAMLTFHLSYYIGGVTHAFERGELTIRDKHSFDCPAITNQEEWNALRSDLISKAEVFVSTIGKLSNEELTESFVDAKYGSVMRNIDAMVEHCYYHLGQAVIIKKIIRS